MIKYMFTMRIIMFAIMPYITCNNFANNVQRKLYRFVKKKHLQMN